MTKEEKNFRKSIIWIGIVTVFLAVSMILGGINLASLGMVVLNGSMVYHGYKAKTDRRELATVKTSARIAVILTGLLAGFSLLTGVLMGWLFENKVTGTVMLINGVIYAVIAGISFFLFSSVKKLEEQ